MKKILFAAFAASLLAAGCQKTEVYQPANSGEKMTFSTEMKKITKAESNEGLDSLQKQGFNIWAYAAFSTENISNVDTDSRIYDGMNAMALTYNTGWNPATPKDYYWPGTGKDLRFFAVSSKDNISENVEITHGISESADHTITLANPSMTIKDYVVASTGNDAAIDDLMVADFLDQNQNENNREVMLDFHHALSKVEFLFKATNPGNASDLNVYVQKLSVLGLCNKGTLSVNTTGFPETEPTYKATVSLSWGDTQDGEVDFTKTSVDSYTAAVEHVQEDGKEIFTENVATPIDPTATASTPVSFAKWLMLPQSITGKLVEIIYIINGRQFKAVFPLNASTDTTNNTNKVTEWGINKYIKYTITLAPNMISFNAKVEKDWETETGIDHIN